MLYVAIQERTAIRIMYENNGVFTRNLTKWFDLPQNYEKFEPNYVKQVNIIKLHTVEGLADLMQENGFKVTEIGSKILDICLLLSCCLKVLEPNHPIYFPILHPLVYFTDKFTKDK